MHYVKLFGPLWTWSCVAFEDSNACILQSTHGTGCVMKQVMQFRQAQLYLRKLGLMDGTHKHKQLAKFKEA